MKKFIAALLAGAMILSLTGCSGEDKKPDSTTQVTQVAFGEVEEDKPDTTSEALEFLKTKVPLFSKYLETRMQYPLTFETEVATKNGTEYAGIYIRDDKTIYLKSVDADGNVSKTIYVDNTLYYVVDSEKAVYHKNYTEQECKDLVSSFLLKIDIDEAKSFNYVQDYDFLDGVEYKHEIIYDAESNASEYFFDETTEELKYVVANKQTSKILELSNTVDTTLFEIPEDYERIDFDEYMQSYLEEKREEKYGDDLNGHTD